MRRSVMIALCGSAAIWLSGCANDELEAGEVDAGGAMATGGQSAVQEPVVLTQAQSDVVAQGYQNCDGTPLRRCTIDESKVSGFSRTGYCSTSPDDYGTHVVCAEVTREFLDFTKARGNDLETPNPYYRFPGLVPGDRWCLCALRWREALVAGKEFAPKVVINATQDVMLQYVEHDTLKEFEVL